MRVQELFNKLHDLAAAKTEIYLKADQRLFEEGKGFLDKEIWDRHEQARGEFQKAMNEYNNFLSYIRDNNIKLDDTIANFPMK